MFQRVLMRPIAWILLAAAISSGCSQKETLNPVTGKVLFEGQPLTGALISFHPKDGKPNVATGFTKEDGTFTVVTDGADGANPGSYIVTIMCQVPIKSQTEGMAFGGMAETEDRLKGVYSNHSTSKIEVTIKDGPNQLEPFDLK